MEVGFRHPEFTYSFIFKRPWLMTCHFADIALFFKMYDLIHLTTCEVGFSVFMDEETETGEA